MSVLRPPSSVLRITFMGTPDFALPTLKALHESEHEIVAVYTQPPRPAGRGQKEKPSAVHQYAEKNGLAVFTPTSLKTPKAQAEFAAHNADIAVVIAYGLLLPKPILEAYKLGCINVHPSKLPRWRGAAPLQRTIMAGDKETAITIMQMDEGLDTGDILLEEPYLIKDGINTGMLHDDIAQKAAPLVLKAIEGLKMGIITPIKQAKIGVEYARKISKEECHINWNQPAEKIYYNILGLSPSPGAYFIYKDEKIKIFAANLDKNSTHPVGSIIDEKLGIAASQGIIYPTELQRAGKKRMYLKEFLTGFSFCVGDTVN